MAIMNISLPEAVREFVEERVERDGYATASEYFSALVREDQQRREHADLEEALIAGLESGAGIEATPEFRGGLREELVARYHARSEDRRR